MQEPSSPTRNLTEREIVTAAVDQVREGGLASLRMRSLADSLSVSPMAIYWHLENKQGVIDAVSEEIVADIGRSLPALRGGEDAWRNDIRALTDAIYDGFVEYPGLVTEMLATQNFPASFLVLIGRGMTLCKQAGLTPNEAALELQIIAFFTMSRAEFDGTRQHEERSEDTYIDRGREVPQDLLPHLDQDDPAVQYSKFWLEVSEGELAEDLPRRIYIHGVDRLIDGVEAAGEASRLLR